MHVELGLLSAMGTLGAVLPCMLVVGLLLLSGFVLFGFAPTCSVHLLTPFLKKARCLRRKVLFSLLKEKGGVGGHREYVLGAPYLWVRKNRPRAFLILSNIKALVG